MERRQFFSLRRQGRGQQWVAGARAGDRVPGGLGLDPPRLRLQAESGRRLELRHRRHPDRLAGV